MRKKDALGRIRRHLGLAPVAIVAVTTAYALVAINRFLTFRTEPFDTGIFANVLWRLAHGHDDVSALSGVHHFADHPSGLVFALVPLARVAGDLLVPLLLVLQAVSVGLVAWATWRSAHHYQLSVPLRWLLLAGALIGPGAYFAAVGEFHESGLALGPIAMTVAGGMEDQRTRRYWIWPVLGALARFELAVGVLLLGIVMWKLGDEESGKGVALTGGIVSLLMIGWLVFNPSEGASVSGHFGHLGSTPGEVVREAVRAPARTLEPLLSLPMLAALAFWLLQFGILAPLTGGAWLIPAIPMVIIPILGTWPPADAWYEHYWHVFLPLMAVGSAWALKRSERVRRMFPMLVVTGLVATWLFLGPFAPSLPHHLELVPPKPDVSAERLVVQWLDVAADESVSVAGPLVSHLATRATVSWYPLPFVCTEKARRTIPNYEPPGHPPAWVVADELVEMTQREKDDVEAVLLGGYEVQEQVGRFTVWRLEAPEVAAAAIQDCE